MVYLGHVTEMADSEDIDKDAIDYLNVWKNILISEKRIPPDAKLKMVANCCS